MKLAKNLQRLGTESAFSILAEAKKLEAQGKTMIHLGLGQPDFKTPKHIVEAAKKQIKADSVILDCEAIAFDKESGDFLPFQQTIQRKRKHGVADAAKNIPLKCFVFDILYLNGEPLINKSLRERRQILLNTIDPGEVLVVDQHLETSDPEEIKNYFET